MHRIQGLILVAIVCFILGLLFALSPETTVIVKDSQQGLFVEYKNEMYEMVKLD